MRLYRLHRSTQSPNESGVLGQREVAAPPVRYGETSLLLCRVATVSCQVIPGKLWLGNRHHARNLPLLQQLGITHVVNATQVRRAAACWCTDRSVGTYRNTK